MKTLYASPDRLTPLKQHAPLGARPRLLPETRTDLALCGLYTVTVDAEGRETRRAFQQRWLVDRLTVREGERLTRGAVGRSSYGFAVAHEAAVMALQQEDR